MPWLNYEFVIFTYVSNNKLAMKAVFVLMCALMICNVSSFLDYDNQFRLSQPNIVPFPMLAEYYGYPAFYYRNVDQAQSSEYIAHTLIQHCPFSNTCSLNFRFENKT